MTTPTSHPHSWVDGTTPITAAKLNEDEADISSLVAAYNSVVPGGSAWRSGTSPNTSSIVLKATGEGSPGVFDLTNNDATGYLFHLHTGVNSSSAAAVIGIGTDQGAGAALLVSAKNNGYGVSVISNPTHAGVAFRVEAYSSAVGAQPALFNVHPAARAVRIAAVTDAGFNDGAVTSGSTTITSASAAFVGGDIGATISQLTSRGEGICIPAGATITAVTNSTTATMSVAATGTATGINIAVGGRVPASSLTLFELIDSDTSTLAAVSRAQSKWFKPMEVFSTSGANPNSAYIDGQNVKLYSYNSGSSNYVAAYMRQEVFTWKLRVYASAAKGSESVYTDMLQIARGSMGFYGTAPQAQPTGTPAAATDATTTQALVNSLRSSLITLGLIA